MQNERIGIIQPGQRFDFNTYRAFREAYEDELLKPDVSHLVVDLSEVQYIDSAALGLLLMLREKVQAAEKTLELRQPCGVVREVLEVAHFNRLFKIS